MKKHDVVYILKNDVRPDELRYSVRSVVANFPHRRVYFYGGKPDGIDPDVYVPFDQTGSSKWERSTSTIKEICKNDDITEDFWLFNDDFFIIRKVTNFPPMVMGSLDYRVQRIFKKHNMNTSYSQRLRDTQRILKQQGYDQLDYACHCPMLINRAKALKTLKKFNSFPMFRSLYGNHHKVGGVLTDDFKIFDMDVLPRDGVAIVSTTDKTFKAGKVGEYIRNMFSEPCEYEHHA